MMIWCTLDILALGGFSWLDDIWVVEVKKEKFNRLHNSIVPYIAENLRPYVI